MSKIISGLVVLAGACLCLLSCGKTRMDHHVTGTVYYVNQTPGDVRIKIYSTGTGAAVREDALLGPGDTLLIKTGNEPETPINNAYDYRPALCGDTTTLIFEDTDHSPNGPNVRSYTYRRISGLNGSFYHIIDTNLKKLAKEI